MCEYAGWTEDGGGGIGSAEPKRREARERFQVISSSLLAITSSVLGLDWREVRFESHILYEIRWISIGRFSFFMQIYRPVSELNTV